MKTTLFEQPLLTSEKSLYYRHLLNACGKSLIYAAGCFAFASILLLGFSKALAVFVLAIIAGVFPMSILALLFLPIVCYRRCPLHPASYSFLGMLAFSATAWAVTSLMGRPVDTGSTWLQAKIVLFSTFYGAPIGFFFRQSLAKSEPSPAGS